MKRLCLILAYLFLFTQTASAMPLLVGQKVVYRGTVTGLRISAVDGTAFIDNAGATIPTYADGNHQIEIYDSSNRMLKGVLKAAGTSEGLGDDLLSGWDLTSGWSILPGYGTTVVINDSNTFTSTDPGKGVCKDTIFIDKGLHKLVFASQDNCVPYMGLAISTRTAFTTNSTSYATFANTENFLFLRNTVGGTTDITTLNLYQVTAPSSSGATITTLKNGDVYNWSYKNSSFSFNSASYYVIIRAIR